ncbi:MAG: hypothetical protein IT453_22735 [Planctomycetes bacterium]|nr:hypothetical protein [Planctomycetota bacterium]
MGTAPCEGNFSFLRPAQGNESGVSFPWPRRGRRSGACQRLWAGHTTRGRGGAGSSTQGSTALVPPRRSTSQLRDFFRPDFINRLDEVLTFQALQPEQMGAIVEIQLKRLQAHLAEQDIQVELTSSAKAQLATEGYDPEFGARPLKRVIQKRVQNLLADSILRGTLTPGSRASIDWRGGRFELAAKRPEPAAAV